MRNRLALSVIPFALLVMGIIGYESMRLEAKDVAKDGDVPLTMKVEGIKANMIEADALKVKHIKLISDDGKHRVTISAGKDGAGIWIDNDKGDNIMITSLRDRGVATMFMNTRIDRDKDGRMAGADIAVSADGSMPRVQMRDSDGRMRFVDISKLADTVLSADKPK